MDLADPPGQEPVRPLISASTTQGEAPIPAVDEVQQVIPLHPPV